MMKKPMLNAIQKVKMSMAMKSKNPKMNPGFDSLPKEVQAKNNLESKTYQVGKNFIWAKTT